MQSNDPFNQSSTDTESAELERLINLLETEGEEAEWQAGEMIAQLLLIKSGQSESLTA